MSGPPAPAVDLAHRDEGQGPPLLLLHGMGGDRLLWNAVATPLVASFRVIVPDLRGHGSTPAPTGSLLTLAELEYDVLRLLDQKQLETAHIIGHSAGAFLALRIALDHPERMRSLTLVSGAAYSDAHTKSIIDRWWSTFAEEGADGLALRLLKDLYYPDWVEAHMDFVDQLYEDVNHRDFTAAVAWGRALKTFDERNSITAIRKPTLIVQAMDDQVMDASHGRILRQSIPGSLIKIYAQTGHMIPVERPAELAAAISEHVRRAESNDPGSPQPS
ncbi:MAG TPA: alpha/beta hydrolase [Thermoplasmata archaeon]|nr:alpha/beta hydrolase [Thermoplasmata archaeon]